MLKYEWWSVALFMQLDRYKAASRQKNFKIIIVVPNRTATNRAIFLFGFYIAEDQLISISSIPLQVSASQLIKVSPVKSIARCGAPL